MTQCARSKRAVQKVFQKAKQPMWLKTLLACLWSLNGPLEKRLLASVSPDAYASTKALAVSFGYLCTRRPLDLSIFANPLAWLLLLVSMLNTPIYARVIRAEDPAIALPFIAATSNALRLVWRRALFDGPALTQKQLVGVAFAMLSGHLTQ